MARRYSTSQIRSKLRQAQQKIAKYNNAVRRYNQGVRTAVNRYNQAVRTHNERVRANRQRLASELARLNSRPTITTTSYVVYRTSVQTLQRSYSRLETSADSQQRDARYNRLLDLSEREAANSAEVTNRILGDQEAAAGAVDELEAAELLDGLRGISTDLDDRWNGAVFSLNPQNPDAARHFCTSAREILAQILQVKAPDADVIALLPDCDRTSDGSPTRRSKIRYFLVRRDMAAESLEQFVEDDIENIVQLFQCLQQGHPWGSRHVRPLATWRGEEACGEWDHVPDRDHRRCLTRALQSPVKAIRDGALQERRGFTQADQVHQNHRPPLSMRREGAGCYQDDRKRRVVFSGDSW